jgi:nucleolar complex protein 2
VLQGGSHCRVRGLTHIHESDKIQMNHERCTIRLSIAFSPGFCSHEKRSEISLVAPQAQTLNLHIRLLVETARQWSAPSYLFLLPEGITMGKQGKQTKRERKFAAKGGVKARLDKGGTIAPKGKVKRKRRSGKDDQNKDVEANKKLKRDKKTADDYAQQQKSQRDSEDFVGRDNLGELDVGRFFANFEAELKNDSGSSDDDSDSDEEKAAKKAPQKQEKEMPEARKKKEASYSSESGDEDSSEDEDEKAATKAKAALKEQAPRKADKSKKKKKAESSSDSSDSEDEDIEAVEARMKAEMKKLQSDDPDFHEFLQENEQQLLEFGEEESQGDDDDDDDDEEETSKKRDKMDIDGDDDDERGEGRAKSTELTSKVLRDLERGAFTELGIKSLKNIMKAYKSACHVNSSTEEGNNDDSVRKKRAEKTYFIEDSQVFEMLMISCLGHCHEAFHFHLLATDEERETIEKRNKGKKKSPKLEDKGKQELPEDDADQPGEDEDDKPLDPKIIERSPRWTELKPILNTFLKSTLDLILESKDTDLLVTVLKALSRYIRFMTPFPRTAEVYLKVLTDLWSAPLGDASADYQVVRLNSFLRIRQLALTQPFPFIEDCLKKTYLAYARRARFGGTGSIMTNALPTLTFMGNCLVELYSLDYHSSYQHAFVYVRQLALFLRTAMQKKTPEAFQNVYCWQYMHCLKLWVAVLAGACKQTSGMGSGDDRQQLMRSLVYPLTEVILGTVRLAPAPARHLPLRFHCVRLLQQLAAATETFIPTVSILLEALDLKEFNMKPKKIKSRGATTRGVQLPFLLKLPKEDPLRTAEEQEACITELFKLLNREADLYRYSAGFPEFSMQLTLRLRKVN